MINTGRNTISNNYIGGSERLCGGSPMTIGASTPHYFCATFINGGTTNPSIVENNTISNINYTSVEDNPWDGIFINSGLVNVTGNTIGAVTGNNSIVVTTPLPSATATITGGVVDNTINIIGGGSGYTTAPIISFSVAGSTTPATATANLTGGVVTSITVIDGGSGYTSAPNVYFDTQSNNYSTSHGILNASSSIVNITNNNIGSITTVGSNTYSHGFESMYMRGVNGTLTIEDNLVGSLSTSNSIQTSSTAGSSLQKQDVYGIYSSNIGVTTITGNTVANIHNAYNGINSGSRARGIQTTAGSNTVQNNTVRNISSASAQSSGASAASVIGISQTGTTSGTTQIIDGNTIYDLSNTQASAKVFVTGIYYAGPSSGTNTVTGNLVHSLSVSSADITATIYGIGINSGVVTCANNIINLGGSSLGYLINGILDATSAGNTGNFYFNTVYLGGSVSSGVTSTTAALNNANNTSTRNYRNNILYNARTGGTTGKHYAIILAGAANTTIDYNDYYFAGTILGKIGSLDKADLTAWKAGTNQDVNSISINPGFTVAGGTSALDYYTSASLPGVTGTGITDDYAGLGRSITPRMGALEINDFVWQGGTSTDFGTGANWVGGVVPNDGADITFASNPDRNCVLDKDRILGNINNEQGTDKLVVNGYKLTINGDLIFSGGAQIDATAASSNVVFGGNLAQNIPVGAFVSNTIIFLTINNNIGLTLNGDLIINEGISLIAGNFAIGPNTLTFNGTVTDMTGTVTGGSSTNMIIGGTGAIINMPAFILNNLTINRANGVSLYGDVSIGGTLTLTAGTLTVGANTLTISGSSPVRTSGTIDASNTGATLAFNNTTAITLPVSIFSAAVNNLTINGAGGITASDNFTINGVLELQNANPSDIKGSLDLGTNTLTMGADATTIGIGDVTGIVKRTSFVANTIYTFGNQYTTISFPNTGTLPTEWMVKITIGSSPTWKNGGIKRIYDIVRKGGTGSLPTVRLHYLDTELNGNTETELVFFGYLASNASVTEYGSINSDIYDNWVSLSGSIEFAPENFDEREWVLAISELPKYTWQGGVPGQETDWTANMNWSGGNVPISTSDVIIPEGCTHYPTLPSNTTINSINIHTNAVINGGSSTTLTINGGNSAWNNRGLFSPETSSIIFTNSTATMSGETSFYNITINSGAGVTLTSDNILRIAGSFVNNGSLDATVFPNTVEYNGADQTIINPNGATQGYYNLSISGSGQKTLPATNLSVLSNFRTSGTSTGTAGSPMTIGGELTIQEGSTFATGAFNHSVSGDFDNSGTFTATAGYGVTLNGTSAQSIYGNSTTTFQKLIIDNSNGVSLLTDANINEELTLTTGNLNIGTSSLGINGTISKTTGFLNTSSSSSLIFGGTSAITLNNELFANTPIINNLTINRSGGVTLGDQDMTVNGLLDLQSGTFRLGENILTIAGSSPTRTTGNIDASNAGLILTFTNTDPIILPNSIFLESVRNMTINGAGGVTSSGDFTLTGILHLQSANPSDTKGSLDMWDGSEMKTLTMGPDATTIGIGDVTGIVKRTVINPEVTYSFGNQFMTAYFPNIGTLPTQIMAKIVIGTSPSWRLGAINREVEIIQTGGSGTKAVFSYHYLDSELNGNDEEHLVFWVESSPENLEYGRSAYNSADNWISLSNINVAVFSSVWNGEKDITLDEYSNTSTLIWNGSSSDSWTSVENWTPNVGPSSVMNIIIPDASTTLHSPILPAFSEIKTLTINAGGILNSDAGAQLTINGGSSAWINYEGTFNPNTSNVIFTGTDATISGTTNFYDITFNSGTILTMTSGATIKISGTVTNNGTLGTVAGGPTIVEYNGGAQTVVVPNPATNRYSSLILSGTGIKTLPGTPLEIVGNFQMSGAAQASASASISFDGEVTLGSGTTFTAGSYTHYVGGNWMNNGCTFVNTESTFNFNGTIAQNIGGTVPTTFNNLALDNSLGITLSDVNTSVTGTLTFNSGKVTTGANIFIMGSLCNSGTITGAGADKYINGNMRRYLPDASDQSIAFNIGDATNYTPVTIFFAGTTNGCGYLDASTVVLSSPPAGASGLSRTKYLNRKWTLTNGGVAGFSSYNPTFTFVSSDIIGAANTADFVVKNLDTGVWSSTTDGIRTSTSSQCIGLTTFGDFYIGEAALTFVITNRNVHSK
jgi:hypothetical protein